MTNKKQVTFNLYSWGFHYDGVKLISSVPHNNVCSLGSFSVQSVIDSIVKEKSFYKKKDIYLNDVKEVKKAIDLELSEAIRLKSKQTHTRKKEHLIKEYTKTLKDVLGKKIVAAFNVDYDESDTYLVIEE